MQQPFVLFLRCSLALLHIGCNLVDLIILTQPKGFVKQKNKMLPLIRARYVRYPAFVEAVADRHQRYNETLAYISMLEQSGRAFVIRPPIPLEIPSMERIPDRSLIKKGCRTNLCSSLSCYSSGAALHSST